MPCAQQGVSTLVRKTFTVADLPKLARIYISGLGYFEAYLNGKKDRVQRFGPRLDGLPENGALPLL